MSADWPVVELSELVDELTVGFVGSMTQEYVHKGIPFFRSKNIVPYNIDWADVRYISKNFHKKLAKSTLRPGDVAIVRTGKPGTACVMPESIMEANCSDVVIARVNNNKLSAHYLAFFMNSAATSQVNSHLVGAVQQHFNVGSAKKIKIPLPPREQQTDIVSVLKSLNDKIELNRQINQTLEEIAQALFKSWFVDFEPTKAKIKAKRSSQRPPLPPGEGPGVRGPGVKPPLPPHLLANARRLRQQLTDAERLLWQLLRGRQLAGCKFRRQHPIGNFILDFYCHDKLLAVELDGGQHNDPNQREADERRTAWLAEQGIKVLRFWNNEVLQETEGVLEEIFRHLTGPGPHPRPLSQGERGEEVVADFVERAAMCAISGKTDDELDRLPAEQFAQLRATAALFPDELVESEQGLIPKGWGCKRIEDILELAYGKALNKAARRPGSIPVYGSGGVNGFHDKPLVKGPGIIVGRKGTVGSLYWENDDFFPIDTVFYVVPKREFSKEYIFFLLQTLGLERMNTDAAVPGLNRNNVYRLEITGHPPNIIIAFSRMIESIIGKITENKRENELLTQLRDTLLPKLLSGEISVDQAGAGIKEAI